MIQTVREQRGMTYEDVAAVTRFEPKTLQKIEEGKFCVDLDDIHQILNLLNKKIALIDDKKDNQL